MKNVKNPSPKLLLVLGMISEHKMSMLDILFEAATRHAAQLKGNEQYEDEVLLTFDLLKDVILES
ncbi:hypothetical protein [Aureispira anguillae]|uniref:Uncharacterized protein n=1 Tax=Aureispira anguillae TaxID=2864201 RepID=A0A916DQH0_9BACT|nr:hypothetical protein [Aureispira anguillae]BDS10090.1 hypothetical protein AsAng_0007970 [Aureispira anguillae]